MGLPGADGGRGGKFRILPRGYDKKVLGGYYVYPVGTNNLFSASINVATPSRTAIRCRVPPLAMVAMLRIGVVFLF